MKKFLCIILLLAAGFSVSAKKYEVKSPHGRHAQLPLAGETVSSGATLPMHLAPGGGFAMILSKE